MRLLALLDLIKDQLSSAQCVKVHQVEQVVQLIFLPLLLGLLLLAHHLLQVNQVSLVPEQLLQLLKIVARPHRVNQLRLQHRNEHLAKGGRILGSRIEQLMPKWLLLTQQIFGIVPEQVDQELVFGLTEHFNYHLVTRIVHVDVELLEEHF